MVLVSSYLARITSDRAGVTKLLVLFDVLGCELQNRSLVTHAPNHDSLRHLNERDSPVVFNDLICSGRSKSVNESVVNRENRFLQLLVILKHSNI